MLTAGAAHAAAITWLAPTAYNSSGSALVQSGTVLSAFSAYGNVTVNYGSTTVAFDALNNLNGAMTFSGFQGHTPTGVTNYNGATNTNFGLALSAFLYDGWQQVTLNNLTIGKSYSVQLFSLDNRGGGFSASPEYFVDSYGDASAKFKLGSDSYVIGDFVADASTESIFVHSDYCHGSNCVGASSAYLQTNEMTNVNAVILRSTSSPVPEPSTALLYASGAACLAWTRRRKSA